MTDMEDLKKLDDEIVRCAEAVHDTLTKIEGARYFHEDATVHALFSAVAAKREASRPKLLSAEEAQKTFLAVVNADASCAEWDRRPIPLRDKALQAVLDADRASILKVVDAAIDDLIEPKCEVTKRAIKSAIRSALSTEKK